MTLPADCLFVLTTLPDAASGERLATALVEEGLAACVSVLAGCHSVYRWQGRVERAGETPLLVKTHAARYADVEAFIRARHPYELPEIVALPVANGLPAYLDWIAQATSVTQTTQAKGTA
ncbi:MAG: divalent-cation tolerance protein CutA [Zoogloeaceae bacterium]|jgi:periplasmic divalent cation tolerance protein|nr:divalent-cation tolerance protein CutA [Zoogloeaceae bacterium]